MIRTDYAQPATQQDTRKQTRCQQLSDAMIISSLALMLTVIILSGI